MKNIFLAVIFLPFLSCNNEEIKDSQIDETIVPDEQNLDLSPEHLLTSVQQLVDSSSFYSFYSDQMTNLTFMNGVVYFEFAAQCHYYFPLKYVGKNKIEVYWQPNEDCVFDIGLMESYDLEPYPQEGDLFAYISLGSDNSLFVDYLFDEWIEEFNIRNKEISDSLFTSSFYLKKL